MKFIAISLHDYHNNQWKDATVNCRVLTLKARNLEDAKNHMRIHHPKTAWIITRCDTTKNIVYATEG